MNGTASFTLDQAYFETYYEDWLHNVRPWKRWLLPAVVALFVAGIGVLVLAPSFRLTGFVMAAIGVFETCNSLSRKQRWLRRMRKIPDYGATVVMEFSDDAICFKSPLSASRFEWAIFPKWHDTPTGLFLCPQSGFAIYVPNLAFMPSEVKSAILERLDRTCHGKRLGNGPA